MGEIFVFSIVVVLIVLRVLYSAQKPADNSWAVAARQLGLRHAKGGTYGDGSVFGAMDGCRVLIRYPAARSSQAPWSLPLVHTQVRVLFPVELGVRGRIVPAGLAPKQHLPGGIPFIRTGDATFDRAAVARSRDTEGMLAFLTPARREAIRALFQAHPGVQYIDHKGIACELGDAARARALIVDTVRAIVAFACGRCCPEGGGATGRGESRPALAGTNAATPVGGDSLEAFLAACEAPALSEDSGTDAPADHDVAATLAEAGEPSAATEHSVAASPVFNAASAAPEQAPASADHGVGSETDVHPCAAALFDPKCSTYETRRVFEHAYRGKEVAWQGTLRTLEDFFLDAELGVGPGVKATVEVAAIASVLGDSERVCAAVAFAPNVRPALERLRGACVGFRGRLVGVDGVSHTIYVGDGVLAA